MPHPYLLDMAIHHVDMVRMTTGREVAGVVDELGGGVTDVAPGDEVFGFAAGAAGAAELAVLADYAPIPPSLDFAGAADQVAACHFAGQA